MSKKTSSINKVFIILVGIVIILASVLIVNIDDKLSIRESNKSHPIEVIIKDKVRFVEE